MDPHVPFLGNQPPPPLGSWQPKLHIGGRAPHTQAAGDGGCPPAKRRKSDEQECGAQLGAQSKPGGVSNKGAAKELRSKLHGGDTSQEKPVADVNMDSSPPAEPQTAVTVVKEQGEAGAACEDAPASQEAMLETPGEEPTDCAPVLLSELSEQQAHACLEGAIDGTPLQITEQLAQAEEELPIHIAAQNKDTAAQVKRRAHDQETAQDTIMVEANGTSEKQPEGSGTAAVDEIEDEPQPDAAQEDQKQSPMAEILVQMRKERVLDEASGGAGVSEDVIAAMHEIVKDAVAAAFLRTPQKRKAEELEEPRTSRDNLVAGAIQALFRGTVIKDGGSEEAQQAGESGDDAEGKDKTEQQEEKAKGEGSARNVAKAAAENVPKMIVAAPQRSPAIPECIKVCAASII